MTISFEGIDSRMSQETLEERVLFEASNRAKERANKDRIKIEDFSDLYSWGVVEKDLSYVRQTEILVQQAHERSGNEGRLGIIFEEITAEQIELNEWLGPNVNSRRASRFDDLRNKVDEILEIHEDDSTNYLALAIDVTTGTGGLEKKFIRIKREIEEGSLATVKYFENSEGSFRGELSKVPRVVIGISRSDILELARAWIEKDNKTLVEHPAQAKIIEEILLQLRAFRDYAEKLKKPTIVKIYDRQIQLLQKIKSSEGKQKLFKKLGASYYREDNIFQAIEQAASRLATQTEGNEVRYIPLSQRRTNQQSS